MKIIMRQLKKLVQAVMEMKRRLGEMVTGSKRQEIFVIMEGGRVTRS